jgi:hypothetical protein
VLLHKIKKLTSLIKNYDIGEYNDIQNFFAGQTDISQIQHAVNMSKLDLTNMNIFGQQNNDETVIQKDNNSFMGSNMGDKIR